MALLFNVILPGFNRKHIIDQWAKIGAFPPNLETALMRCTDKTHITPELFAKCRAAEKIFVDEIIRTGELSDDTMILHLGRIGKVYIGGDLAMRSRRVLIMSHPTTVEKAVGRRDRSLLVSKRREEKKRGDQEAREKKDADEIAAKLAAVKAKEAAAKAKYDAAVLTKSEGKKVKAQEIKDAVRYASKTGSMIEDNDAKCKVCGIIYSILNEWIVGKTPDWYNCDNCGADLCQWCQNMHQKKCNKDQKVAVQSE
jgi:hypothetical protein